MQGLLQLLIHTKIIYYLPYYIIFFPIFGLHINTLLYWRIPSLVYNY